MAAYTTRYKFSQRFKVPAEDAYRWATDYRSDDWSLMGKRGKRSIEHLSENAIILSDRVYGEGRYVSKRRLVLLYPERLSWTNTHIGGPNKHSQFLYEIIPEGKNSSRLDFTGFQIDYGATERPTPEKIESLSNKLREDDAGMWRLLAKAMERDLKSPRRRR